MTIIQTTARVPEQHRDLMLSVCARLRDDETFGSKLAEFMHTSAAPSALLPIPDMDRIRRELEAVTQPAVRDLSDFRAQLEALTRRVGALEAGKAPVAPDSEAKRAVAAALADKQQMDIEAAIAASRDPQDDDQPKKASGYKPATPEQKAERKAFADEIRAMFPAVSVREIAERLSSPGGADIAYKTALNILGGVTHSSAEVRTRIREAAARVRKD